MGFFNWTSTWIPSSEWPSSVLTNQNPSTHFSAKKLKIKPSVESQLHSSSRITISNSKMLLVFTSDDGKLIHAVHDMFLGVGLGLLCMVMKCVLVPKFDDLTLTTPGTVLDLGALSYFWAALGVTPWLFDLFMVAFSEGLFRPTYKRVLIEILKIFCSGEEGVDNAKYNIPKWKTENANYKQSIETTKKKVYTC
ncbi:hypothetical protein DVH24_033533 [Malus domestica]|uniref:Uncharacterized protein n=1 Tax=Malus domestica TaxID=3750 RepID=A0A498JCU7_MALDO|nr:hypothetical protein DVH24_033533 [Malus domestica]